MLTLAASLVRRVITPPRRQLRSGGPSRRWFSSQALRRGEPREAAQAASSTNSVVGSPGSTTPSNARPMAR